MAGQGRGEQRRVVRQVMTGGREEVNEEMAGAGES